MQGETSRPYLVRFRWLNALHFSAESCGAMVNRGITNLNLKTKQTIGVFQHHTLSKEKQNEYFTTAIDYCLQFCSMQEFDAGQQCFPLLLHYF